MSYITDYLLGEYKEAGSEEFYRSLFPQGELQERGVYEKGKYNGIAVEVVKDTLHKEKPNILRHTITDDLEKIQDMTKRDNFCLMSPISYIGKHRRSENARILYALAIDLDGIRQTEKNPLYGITTLFHQMHNIDRIPIPTYVVSSGTGVHLYYVFKEPLLLYPGTVKKLQVYKRELTRILWQDDITSLSYNVQYESLFQGFRIVGTRTKKGDRTRAFLTGETVSLEYMNYFVDEEFKLKDLAYKSKLSLAQAKEKYPEWYEKRVINKMPRGTWTAKRDLYDWWKERILKEAKTGHRYYCMMCLAIYARKAGISLEELEQDAFTIGKQFSKIPSAPENPFTEADILDALEAYNDRYITYPVGSISYVSGIHIQKNKRNYRPQEQHLERARAVQEIDYPKGSWRNLEGRPTKQDMVEKWQQNNPEGKKIDCHRETKLDPKTIRKWWNDEGRR